MFVLRASPNRDSLLSPCQLVYGKRARTPLDLLHYGWIDEVVINLKLESGVNVWVRS